MNIANAVKIAVARGEVDGEWKRARLVGQCAADIHMANEHFALCSGSVARADYYKMYACEIIAKNN